MHESTFQLTFGGQTLVAVGDTIDSEVDFVRTPAAPNVVLPLRASAARLFGGGNLTHSLSWIVRREFDSIEEARAYEWTRMAGLPEGGQTLVITDSGITATLVDAHLTDFRLAHARGQAGIIIESVSVLGGALSFQGAVSVAPPLADPAAPADIPQPATGEPGAPSQIPQSAAAEPGAPAELQTQPAWLLLDGKWNDDAYWLDQYTWSDAA